MFDIFRQKSCVEAAKLLEKNVELSHQLSEALGHAVEDVTTVFDRRKHEDVTVPAERRKAAG